MPTRTSPEVWGILNVTPDSFSDGGRWLDPADAVARGLALERDGADVIDVGGESTRPGATPVDAAEEAARVLPVIEGLVKRGLGVPISVDTAKASVAAPAFERGARIANDVSAAADPGMLRVVAEHGASIVLMHRRGDPATMQKAPRYGDVVVEVLAFLVERRRAALDAGIPPERAWIDPGIGFGKTPEHNVALLRALERFVATEAPVLVGASRKSFLGALTGAGVEARIGGSLAAAARARDAGVAAVRVHDVRETRDLFRVLDAVS
jgi:dihydropteroate synthase